MRITVDIDDDTLESLSHLTGERKKSPAVAKAVAEYVRKASAKQFGRRLFEGDFSNAFEENFDPKAQDS